MREYHTLDLIEEVLSKSIFASGCMISMYFNQNDNKYETLKIQLNGHTHKSEKVILVLNMDSQIFWSSKTMSN